MKREGQKSEIKSKLSILERELEESKKLIDIISRGKYQWQATFDAISDPVMIITTDFDIVRANLGLAGLAGRDIRSMIGKKCYKYFAGRDDICPNCPVPQVLDDENKKSSRLGVDIHERDFIANAFPFVDEVDGKESIVVHYRDITREKVLQQELMQQEKMAAIGMLAGGVAHEINNPLGGIIAFSQLIKRELNKDEPVYQDILEIEDAAQRCKKIVEDLLDFSRVTSSKKKVLFDITPLIEKVIPLIKMELKSLNIELKTDLYDNLPKVVGNPNKLQQVFLNLFTNACYAMKSGGVLNVSTFINDSEDKIIIQVEDTGVGIEEKDLSRLFDPFFTTKPPGEGTGLGLSISYKIIREHKGNITVKSSPGKGSVFTIELPVFSDD